MPLARARDARQLRVTRGDAGDPGAARTPSSSKETPGLPRLGWVLAKPYASRALWLLCGCSWQAPAGSRRAPEAAQLRAGTAGCVGGCWGGHRGTGTCPLRLRCPWCQGWQRRCSVAEREQIHVLGSCSRRKRLRFVPTSPRRWHRAVPGMGLSRGPGDPAWAAKSLDGFGMDGGCSRPVLLLAGGLWHPRSSLGNPDIGTAPVPRL